VKTWLQSLPFKCNLNHYVEVVLKTLSVFAGEYEGEVGLYYTFKCS
jgi:hypothetical protein